VDSRTSILSPSSYLYPAVGHEGAENPRSRLRQGSPFSADAPAASDLVALQIKADLELRQLAHRTAAPDPEAALAGRACQRARGFLPRRLSDAGPTTGG